MDIQQLRQGANGSRILLALDGLPLEKARPLGAELAPYVAGGKVNDLIDQVGEKALEGLGFVINFYDPKIHDIQNTVRNRLLAYRTRADMVTIHASMKMDSLRVAAQTAEISGFACIAVTLLTDMSPDDCRELYGISPGEFVQKHAQLARKAGLHGIVCSPQETKMVRRIWPEALIINPGVRLAGSDKHDQARVGTPEQAIRDGADLIVVGRDIINKELSSERFRQVMRYNEEINNALAFA